MDFGDMKKIKVTICPNYFDRSQRIDHIIDYKEGLTVFQIISFLLSQKLSFSSAVNGKIIKENDYYLTPGDHVILVPNINSDIGKFLDPWEAAKKFFESGYSSFTDPKGSVFDSFLDSVRNSFASIPVVNTMQDLGETLARNNPEIAKGLLGVMGIIGGPWGKLGALVLNYAGSRYGIWPTAQAPNTPGVPSVPSASISGGGGGMGNGGGGGSGFSSSNSYSWSPQTMQQIGAMIPRIYGTFISKGNVISSNVDIITTGTHPGDQVLNCLLLLCQGPIYNIRDVKLNNKGLASYPGVLLEYKYGHTNQTYLPNFNDTYTEYTVGLKTEYNVAKEYVTEGGEFDAIKITMSFPSGLWEVFSSQTEMHYEDVYLDWVSYNPITKQWENRHDYIGQKYVGMSTYGGDTVAHSVAFAIHYKKTTDTDWIYYGTETVTEAKTSSFVKIYKIDSLKFGSNYNIRVTRTTEESDSPQIADDMYFSAVTEVTKDDFSYPRMALVGIQALATSQLSGSLDFTCTIDGSIVQVWNGSAWVSQWSDNPAWVAYDILTMPVYEGNYDSHGVGMTVGSIVRYDGVDPTQIDTASFKAWADFCDGLVNAGEGGTEKRFVFNGVFDSAMSQWDALLEVCRVARAMVIIKGYKYYVIFDSVSTPVQMFTAGNIIQDSFKETFLSTDQRSCEIEVDFCNENNNYERETVTIMDPNAAYTKQQSTAQYLGCTKRTQAWRTARYTLYNNQYVSRFIEFDADIDAIACNVGDLIYFAHELPQWGFSGRLVAAASTTVTLDRTVSLTPGITYGLRIRLKDDTIVYKTTTGSGSVSQLTVSAFSTIPEALDIYTFGVDGTEYKPFRINKIQPNPDLTFSIEAVEYNETIYNCDTDEPASPTTNYSSLDPIPPVTNIYLDEIVTKLKDGTIVNNIDVYWDTPTNFAYNHAEIWYKAASSMAGYKFAGRSYVNQFRIENLPLTAGSELYTVMVVTVTSTGIKLPFDDCPTLTITANGMADPPSNVQQFQAAQANNEIRMDWKHIEDADLWGYEIRMGAAWDTGLVIGSKIVDDYFYYRPEISGTYQFFICAIDTTNHYSTTPKSCTVSVYNIDPSLNVVFDHDYVLTPASGTLYNFTYGSGNGLCSGNSFQFNTSAASGYFETKTIDLLRSGNKTVRFVDEIDSSEDVTDLTFPDRTDLTYPDDTDLHISSEYFKYPSFICSDSTGFYDAAYTPYYGPRDVNARYFKFREDFRVPSDTALLSICSFRPIIDVPEQQYKIPGYTITAATGANILFATYGLTFWSTPSIGATIINSAIAVVPYISNKSNTGFTIKAIDIIGTGIAGVSVDINIFGY
jgi:predicted phage tail protein